MEKCAYDLCQCLALPGSRFCDETCEWLAGGLLGSLSVRSSVPLKTGTTIRPGCGCGHSACDSDAQVYGGTERVH